MYIMKLGVPRRDHSPSPAQFPQDPQASGPLLDPKFQPPWDDNNRPIIPWIKKDTPARQDPPHNRVSRPNFGEVIVER